jgi:hypothetical protein
MFKKMKGTSLKYFLPAIIVVFCFQQVLSSNSILSLYSPAKRIKAEVRFKSADNNRQVLTYEIVRLENKNSIQLLESSPLGISRNDQSFTDNLKLTSCSKVRRINESYSMTIGRHLKLKNCANEQKLTFKNDSGSTLEIIFRVYNNGVAFKYVFPDNSDKKVKVISESTSFNVPDNGVCWIQPYDKPGMWTPGHELYYKNEIPIGTKSPNSEGWAFPALFKVNNNWMLISEANLTKNYCGTRLAQDATNGLYQIRFPEPADGEGVGEVYPSSTLPWEMPWRFIAIGESLDDIYNNNLVTDLSNKAINKDFSWVKPGRASWSWISAPDSPCDYNALKKFVDLSAEMGWEYSLVDANWDTMTGGSLQQLVKYAAQKDVGILVWYNSGGPNNKVPERPRDLMTDRNIRREEFQKLQQWGVKGIKVDFWHSDKQLIIQQYIDLLSDAADYHIMVNFHGCTIPRGWSRTYPNLISMESVKGAECYLFDSTYTDNAPVQNTILPFTRNVIGPMDYTPLVLKGFKMPHKTTFAHELALTLVFQSGILHFAEDAGFLNQQPDFVKTFLKTIPVTFDESHLLSGYPGKDIIIASRKGKTWYLAGINGESKLKNFDVKLPFIKGNCKINIIKDGDNAHSFENIVMDFKSRQNLQITTIPYGGFVIKITK